MPTITINLGQRPTREIAKNPIRCVAVYNKVQRAVAFVIFNRIPDKESGDIIMEIRSGFGDWGRRREVLLLSGKLGVKLRVLFQRKGRQRFIDGLFPEQPVKENIETGDRFNLNYSACVTNFVNEMKYKRSIAPSRTCEAGSHSLFARFLGISGHKKMLSVKLATCFTDSSWNKYFQKRNKK